MSDFCSIVERFKGKRVVVFGDLVADVFVYGEISRISREAPVLILNHRETQVVPGGGANAIHNLWALGAKPVPVGMVGDDSEGQQLVDFFSRLGIDVSGIYVAKSYRTPTKMRILAGAIHSQRQQIVRIDSGGPIEEDKSRDGIEQKLKLALNDADGFLVSDYGYSLVTPYLVSKVRKDSIPATIDSRFSMMEFSKLTAATPTTRANSSGPAGLCCGSCNMTRFLSHAVRMEWHCLNGVKRPSTFRFTARMKSRT